MRGKAMVSRMCSRPRASSACGRRAALRPHQAALFQALDPALECGKPVVEPQFEFGQILLEFGAERGEFRARGRDVCEDRSRIDPRGERDDDKASEER
jgi:hypothetical protein